jgi:organic radical activating enzyme
MLMEFNITKLISGGIITNYFCSSHCAHCLYRSGPGWPNRYIDPGLCENMMSIVNKLGCRSVHIGGGEPLLRPDELIQVIETARRFNLAIEYVETNSSWFKDSDSAKMTLSRLRKAGLRTLLISISPFHNQFVPFLKVSGVMEACRQTGIQIFPWITEFISDLSQFDPHKTHTLEEYTATFGDGYLAEIPERYWIHMGGRALELFRPVMGLKPIGQIMDENSGDCARELSDTSHYHIDLFGNYIPGLCSGLAIAAHDLGRPLARERYPLLTTLFSAGIKGLLGDAQKIYGFTPLQNGYINKCDLCTEIRTFLVHQNFNQSFELNPKEFYRLR